LIKEIYNNDNYIKETIAEIDKIQKEVQIDNTNTCISCKTSLINTLYNTIPISLKCINNADVTGNTSLTPTFSGFFRVESIRQNRFVTLRLLNNTDGNLEATEYTMIVDLDYVMALQCYSPINVTLCNQTNS